VHDLTQRPEADPGSKSGRQIEQLGTTPGPFQMMVLCGARKRTRYQ
jgi:hypothetical protein